MFTTLDSAQHKTFLRHYQNALHCNDDCPLLICRADEPEMYTAKIVHNYRMTDMDLMSGAAAMGGGGGGTVGARGIDGMEHQPQNYEQSHSIHLIPEISQKLGEQ